jgi:hypothetical protein
MKGITHLAAAVGIWLAVCVLSIGFGLIPLAIWALLVFVGAEGRAARAQAQLERTLMTGETLIAAATQHRVFALFKRRAVLAITSSRVLTLQRGLIGGFRMVDMQWKDLKDVRIEQNILDQMCGSNLAFDHLTQPQLAVAVDGIPSEIATTMYARSQSEEQAWEEKRRIRSLEEMRAQAGGVTVGTTGDSGGAERVVDDIQRAKSLLDSGAISDAEFQEMKAKILGRA